MKTRLYLYIVFGLGIVLLSFSMQDQLSEMLEGKIRTYYREKQPSVLYTHIDRNIYMPGDTLWFKSYAFSGLVSEVMHVRLVDDNSNIVMQQQFPMYDIRAHGDVALPDTLKEGKYLFYTYTDRMMNFDPDEVFVQQITISTNLSERVDMELFAINKNKILRGEEVKVGLRVKDKSKALKGITGQYSIYVGNEHLKTREIGTNSQGEAYIDFTYPKIADSQSVRFLARLHGERQYAALALNLRHEGNFSKVTVYPEGGQLLDGVLNRTVVQVMDNNKNPMATTLTLRQAGKDIARIKTNNQGIGSLLIKPDISIAQSIIFNDNGQTRTVPLPAIAKEGYSLKLVKEQDRYFAVVHNKGKPDNPALVLRSFKKVIWTGNITVKPGDSIRTLIPTGDFSPDILSLGIFEPNGAPAAERTFMNKWNEKAEYTVHVDTVKELHGNFIKVKVTLRVTDKQGNPVKTNLSASVTEKSTFIGSDFRNIWQSFHFHHLPNPADLTENLSDADLDLHLISKNWNRYDWQHIVNHKTAKVILLKNTAGINGVITKKIKRELKPPQIFLWSKSGVKPVELNEEGYFSIHPEDLMVNPFEGKYLILGENFYDYYKIKFLNSPADYDEKLKAGAVLHWPQAFNQIAKYVPPPLNTFGKDIQLNEVKISALGSVSIRGRACANECGDYVCLYRVLNCPNHSCLEKPKVGYVYRIPYKPNMIYNGCGKTHTLAPQGSISGNLAPPPTSLRLQAINYPNDFFLPDYVSSPPGGPDMRSTIFWAPNLYTDAQGTTSFEFQKGGVKREFTVVIQGLEVNTLRPVYYLHKFEPL